MGVQNSPEANVADERSQLAFFTGY